MPALALLGLGVLGVGGAFGGCLLGNIDHDACASDDTCVLAFGLGSACVSGFCTDAVACTNGHDCRARFNGGACVDGFCVDVFPAHPQCTLSEPADLTGTRLTGPSSPLIIGGIFGLDDVADLARTAAAQLAVREINDVSGLNEGRRLALVVCDDGGEDNNASGDERRQLNHSALDYLSGVLGVPAIVGPGRSSDSLILINHALAQRYPSVIISPAATSPQLSVEPDRLDPDDPHGLFWRTCPSDELQGKVLATSVVGKEPVEEVIDEVAVIYLDDAYGLGLATVFGDEFAGTTNLFPFDESTDFEQLTDQVADEDPDGVLIISVRSIDTVAFLEAAATTSLNDKRFYLTDGSKDAAGLFDEDVSDGAREILRLRTVGTAPAIPSSSSFDAFAAALDAGFDFNAEDFSFMAQSYDAAFVAAYGVVFASRETAVYDGRRVAEGLARLTTGDTVLVGKNGWASAKQGLTTGSRSIDIEGISGPLDFDAGVGEAPGPIEVWRPRDDLSEFEVITVIQPE